MKYCDQFEKIYSKNNFIVEMTWHQFVENGHRRDIIHYLNCLNHPSNPHNVRYGEKQPSIYKGMQKPFTDKCINKLITQYDLTFDESIYMFLTNVSRTYIDNSFTPFFNFDELRHLYKKTGLSNLIDNKDKIFVSKTNDRISISIDTYFTNIKYFMIKLHHGTFNGDIINHLEVEIFYIYLGKTLELNNFVLKNGTIWTLIDDDDNNTHIKRCDECNDKYFTENYVDYHYHDYITYQLILPSILDLCVLTVYNEYQSVCRWDG